MQNLDELAREGDLATRVGHSIANVFVVVLSCAMAAGFFWNYL